MSPQTITDLWPTKSEAAKRLQCAEKTIDRMIKRGDLRSRPQKLPGRGPFIGICPEDLDKAVGGPVPVSLNLNVVDMSSQSQVPSIVQPPVLAPVNPPAAIVPVPKEKKPRRVHDVPPVPVHLKHRVTTAEAIELGYSEKLLNELRKEGKVERICGHYRVRDLAAL